MLTDELEHRISVGRLASLLRQISEDYILQTNALGNLAILDTKGVYIGFIDLVAEKVKLPTLY